MFDAAAYVDRHWDTLRDGFGGLWQASFLRVTLQMFTREHIPTNNDAIAVAAEINRRRHGPVKFEDSYASVEQAR